MRADEEGTIRLEDLIAAAFEKERVVLVEWCLAMSTAIKIIVVCKIG